MGAGGGGYGSQRSYSMNFKITFDDLKLNSKTPYNFALRNITTFELNQYPFIWDRSPNKDETP